MFLPSTPRLVEVNHPFWGDKKAREASSHIVPLLTIAQD